MLDTDSIEWLDHVQLTRELRTPGERNAFYKRVRQGEFVLLCRGAYVQAALWSGLDADARHRALVKAVAALEPADVVFSHSSAAALWRLPRFGRWPAEVHALNAVAAGGRSSARLVRHVVGVPTEQERIEGLAVSSLARTVVDLSRTEKFPVAVVAADAALRRNEHPHPEVPLTALTNELLLQELAEVPTRHGTARARRVLVFADGAADRPGESLSRVGMFTAGITMPELQVPLFGASGRRYIVDFFWRMFNTIGEFDGKAKYREAAFLRGRTPEQALLDEKDREDDLRAAGHGMSRWGWSTAVSARRLRDHLARAGVR
jgi:hypothetical protein